MKNGAKYMIGTGLVIGTGSAGIPGAIIGLVISSVGALLINTIGKEK